VKPPAIPSTQPDHVPMPSERAKMVGWFDVGQLLRTGIKVIVTTAFGENADRRILDAVIHHAIAPCDYSEQTEDIWFDYVADTGDGWNPTYAIAYFVAQPELTLECGASTIPTKRGQLLIFGGDEVYPTASRAAYEQRLVMPYRTALPHTDAPHPVVFAVAGNHDWYDSLVAFSRLFCSQTKRWFGGRETRQTLSYFSVKLPHDWWLIGTDVQLDSDIDDPQLDYFREIAKLIPDDGRVILCTAEPHWIYEAKYAQYDPTITARNLDFLEKEIFKRKIEVYLSGDLHHYRRHEDCGGRQKITAGGGGAFLHPTHGDEQAIAELRDEFRFKCAFPSPADSRRLAWGNLKFPWLNPTCGIATATLYLLLAWAVNVDVGTRGIGQLSAVLSAIVNGVLLSQIAVLWTMLLFLGFYFFTDTHSPRYRLFGGSAHALAHLIAVLVLGWFGSWLSQSVLGFSFRSTEQLLSTGAVIAAGGYLVGPMIIGLYLLISLNGFGRQSGEFSSLHCEDYKSWLRLRITSAGTLEIYPIGIDRVPRHWRKATEQDLVTSPSLLLPDDDGASRPHLIEPPIAVPKRARV
jgi:hypothetical protein